MTNALRLLSARLDLDMFVQASVAIFWHPEARNVIPAGLMLPRQGLPPLISGWQACARVVYKPRDWKILRAAGLSAEADVGEGGHARALDARQLARETDPPGAGLSGPGGARDRGASARDIPAAGIRRRGAQPRAGARPRRHGRGFPAARRGLRRELLRAQRQ